MYGKYSRGRLRGFFLFSFSFFVLFLLSFCYLFGKMKISDYQIFSLKIPVCVYKHNLLYVNRTKYDLWKHLKTIYIQKILKPPTTSF